jgi:DNA repair exonuclease SbcCD ATPase subunit
MKSNRFRWPLAAVLAGCALALLPHTVLGEAAEKAIPSEDAAAHYAKGEVKYGEVWISLAELFQNCRQVHVEMEKLLEESKKAQSALDDLNRQIYTLRGENDNSKRPVRTDMAKAVADKRKADAALRAQPPTEPRYEREPLQPAHVQYSSDSYRDAMDNWRSEVRRIRDQNTALKREYDKRLAEYQKAKAEANSVIQAAQAKVAECQKQLAALDKQFEDAQTPVLAKRVQTNDQIQSLGQQARALLVRAQAMEQAMREAPETVLFRGRIVEWDGKFYPLDELRALYAETQGEIDRVRDQLREDARLAGRSFPDDWRHPQQDKIDALKILIERAEKEAASAR